MRRVRIMAAECADLIQSPDSDPIGLVSKYFAEIQAGLQESQVLHPAREQVDFVFRESDDRWVNFCRKLTEKVPYIELNTQSFHLWSDGKVHEPLIKSYRRPLDE